MRRGSPGRPGKLARGFWVSWRRTLSGLRVGTKGGRLMVGSTDRGRVAWLAASAVLIALIPTLSIQQPASAATVEVTNCHDSGAGSLRQAVADAAPGDTIRFALSPRCSVITLTSGPVTISQSLTIEGPGTQTLALSGANLSGIFSTTNPGAGPNPPTISISGLTLKDAVGTALSNWDATVQLAQMLVTENNGIFGGGIFNFAGSVDVTDCVISNNSAVYGGGIDNGSWNATLNLVDSTVSGNTVGANQGPIIYGQLNPSGLLSASSGEGAGIFNQGGSITIVGTTISNNQAINGGRGGGIDNENDNFVFPSMELMDSTVAYNSAGYGGGVFSSTGSTSLNQINDSTIAFNTANNSGGGFLGGGGLWEDLGGISLSDVTISENAAAGGSGGGVFVTGGSLILSQSIVAHSGGGLDCVVGTNGTIAEALSLDDDGSCGSGSYSLSNTPSGLQRGLANNGGPTQTIALMPGSPAVDWVTPLRGGFCSGNDQRGVPWPTPCSIGAVELSAPSPTELEAHPAVIGVAGVTPYLFDLSATLSTFGVGLPFEAVTFSAGGSPLCTTYTDDTGTASCEVLAGAPTAMASEVASIVAENGYTVTFAGDANNLPSRATGGLIG